MVSIGLVALIVGSISTYVWLCLKRAGVGQPDGKPDCGCGSGAKCKIKVGKQ